MKLQFHSIQAHNFMSFEDLQINFDNNTGINLINGVNKTETESSQSNGSGKSTISESIYWVLTGQTLRGTRNVENFYRNDDNGTFVKLNLSIDNDNIILVRYKNDKKYKTNLKIYVNDEDKSGKGLRESEKIWEEMYPSLNEDLICSCIILGQGLPNKFTDYSPTERKSLIERIFNIDILLSQAKESLSKRKDEIDDNRKKSGYTIEFDEKELKSIESQIETTKTNLETYSDEQFGELNTKYNDLLTQKENENFVLSSLLKHQRDTQSLHEEKVKEYKDIFAQREAAITDARYKWEAWSKPIIDKTAEIKTNIHTVESEINKINNIIDVCPTCGQKLNGVVRPDTSNLVKNLSNLKEELEQHNLSLNQEKSKFDAILCQINAQYGDKIKELDSDVKNLSTLCNSDDVQINQTLINIKNLSSKEQDIYSKITKFGSEVEYLKKTLFDLETKRSNYQQKIEETNQLMNKYCNQLSANAWLQSALKDYRTYILNNVIGRLSEILNQYAEIVIGSKCVSIEVNNSDLDITVSGKDFDNLSGGEKQKINVIIQLAFRKILCETNGVSSNILFLDEIFDNCDYNSCQMLLNLIYNELRDIKNVYIITHHADELNITYDNIIYIVKENNISRVVTQ